MPFGLTFDLSAFIYAIFGGLIGAAVSLWFARKASRELQTESGKLRRMVSILAHALHNAGAINAEFDEHGELVNFVLPISGAITLPGLTIQAQAAVTPPPKRKRWLRWPW